MNCRNKPVMRWFALRGPVRYPTRYLLWLSLLGLGLSVLTSCGSLVAHKPTVARPQPNIPSTKKPLATAPDKRKIGDPYVILGKRYYPLQSATGYTERGIASWYGKKFHGRKTANGEIYDMYQLTAAHTSLPLPTYVQVTNLSNKRSAIVKVNDRGPFHENRIIDLSYAAALKLGIAEIGTAFVEVRALDANGKPDDPVLAETSEQFTLEQGVYLQVGAFQDATNARRLATEIRSNIADEIQIREVSASGKILHRVQVGPLASVEAADQVVAVLANMGISNHHFVGP